MRLRRDVSLAVAAVAVQRLGELVVSGRHERRLREEGAVEVGAWQHPLMVALHSTWMIGTLVEGSRSRSRRVAPVVALLSVQPLRYWAIRSLGRRWTTRVLVLPDREPIRRGPYRYVRHPNYVAVVVEIAALPLVFGARRTAAVGSLANAALLAARIRDEEQALRRATPGAGAAGSATRERDASVVLDGASPECSVRAPVRDATPDGGPHDDHGGLR